MQTPADLTVYCWAKIKAEYHFHPKLAFHTFYWESFNQQRCGGRLRKVSLKKQYKLGSAGLGEVIRKVGIEMGNKEDLFVVATFVFAKVEGGVNWAEMGRKRLRSSLTSQLLAQTSPLGGLGGHV